MLLKDRTAIVHGAGGTTDAGGTARAVAAALERAGARVFRAVLDPMDEHAVQAHTRSVTASSGGLDLAVIVLTGDEVLGIPLIDLTVPDLVRPTITHLAAAFIGARAAARPMVRQGSGVIIVLDGGSGPATAVVDSLLRDLDAEVGPRGVRCARIGSGSLENIVTAAAQLLLAGSRRS